MKFRIPHTRIAMMALGLLVGGAASAEHAVVLRGAIGYDDNPFELNEIVATRAGMFVDMDAVVSAEGQATNGWRKKADLELSGRAFETSMSDANEGRIYVRAGGDSNEEPTKNGWDWSLQVQARDRTYVSSKTGEEATDDAGNSIGNRFDYLKDDFEAGWHFPRKNFGRISVEGLVSYKDYLDDYQESGLDRLDWLEYGIAPQYEIGDRDSNLRIRLKVEERLYADRRVSDAAGNPVPGTDLEYRYYAAEIRYQRRLSRRNSIEWIGDYDLREDNGVGHADRTKWSTSTQWTYHAKGNSSLSAQLQYSTRTFDEQSVNDEVPAKNGFDVALKYARPFPFLDLRGFSLVAEAGWESFDNTRDVRYEYDRLVGFLGVRKEY